MSAVDTSVVSFDILGELPKGRLALEASAGTGKTFTLAALVTRYVAEEDVPIGEILLVTFTRAAAAELRERVRDRLDGAAKHLAAVIQGLGPPSEDQLLVFLATHSSPDELKLRQRRLEVAVADFDTATITTIHSFAQIALSTLGMLAPGNPDAVLTEDTSDVLEESISDALTKAALARTLPEGIKVHSIRATCELLMGNAGAELRPTLAELKSGEALEGAKGDGFQAALIESRAIVEEIMSQVAQRRAARSVMSFDDVLTLTRRAVTDSVTGPSVARLLRARFQVALIDEFQDTDSNQWDILRTVFGVEGTHLVVVGDPKQAIYRFRGANIDSYLAAAHEEGTERATLAVNWRSDGAVLNGIEAIFSQADFGDSRIRFHPVEPAPHHFHRHATVESATVPGVRLRVPDVARSKLDSDPLKAAISADVAAAVVDVLENVRLPDPSEADQGSTRSVRPGDVAILVKAHNQASPVQTELQKRGVRSVIGRVGSVLATEAASQMYQLLTAVAAPASRARSAAAAIGWFFGWSHAQLAAALEDTSNAEFELGLVQRQLHAWSEVLEQGGVHRFFEQIFHQSNISPRILAKAEGERHLTDLHHVRELLEADAGRQIHRLVEWFELLMSEPPESEPDQRRIESDDDAVQIMTVHAAKGLEFPIVCCPFLSTGSPNTAPVLLQDPDSGQRTVLMGTKDQVPMPALRHQSTREVNGELMRVAYVAATRAQHQLLLWFGRSKRSGDSALGSLLFPDVALPDNPAVAVALAHLPLGSGGNVAVELFDPKNVSEEAWTGSVEPRSESQLKVAALDRSLDRSARRWSFTAVSRQRVHPETESTTGVADQADEGTSDEATPDGLTINDEEIPGSDLPLGDIPGGAAFGTLVHEILEVVDYASPTLATDIAELVGEAASWSEWPLDNEALSAGLLASMQTPLGPLFHQRPLTSFTRSDRLDEMTFEFNLAEGGEVATGQQIGQLILRHLGEGDPLRGWARDLAVGLADVHLAGHLTGSIDGTFRVKQQGHPDRFVVVDYKTNRLGTWGEPLLGIHYQSAELPKAMAHHDYPLQALLYTVALHRYLRWRLPDYDPALNLGGAVYLFLRGMQGEGTPTTGEHPNGVFSWTIPPELVVELSDLLHGGGS